MYLIGVDNPILDFSGHFSSQGGCSFYAENITFYKIGMSFSFFATVSFKKCIFTGILDPTNLKLEGLYIENIYNVTISNCLFRNNDAQYDFINIENVVNVEISGCEFYQNKCRTNLSYQDDLTFKDDDSEHIYEYAQPQS